MSSQQRLPDVAGRHAVRDGLKGRALLQRSEHVVASQRTGIRRAESSSMRVQKWLIRTGSS